MTERDANQLAANQPCVCGGNDWIRSDAYGKPYENGYALCGHCARPNTARGQRRDAQLAADVRAGVAEPHRANNRHEYRQALAALDELVALVGTLQQERAEHQAFAESYDVELRERAEAAEAALATTRQANQTHRKGRP